MTLLSCRLAVLPCRQVGDWRIERHVEDAHSASFGQLRAAINGHGRYTPAGEYIGLRRGRDLVMSNVPDELRDLWPLRLHADGHVLVAGLGLGCAVDVLLARQSVTHVTVIEVAPEVIELIGASFAGERVTILLGDIFTWKPPKGARYGAAWFDIWDSICGDNLPQMMTLHRRFGRWADWKGSWCRHECRRY